MCKTEGINDDASRLENGNCKIVEISNFAQIRLPSFGLDPDTLVFAPPHHDGMGSLMSKDMHGEDMDSNIQWYRPRSLVNAEEDIGSSSLLSGSEDDYGTHVSQIWVQKLS